MKNNKIKRAQGSVILSLFFIIIVLIMVFLFTNYNKTILVSNYNTNLNKMRYNTLYSLKEELILCYGYPLEITSIDDCPSLKKINFKIKAIEDTSCPEGILLENGVETNFELNLFFPVYNQDLKVCPAQLYLYFE